jgi:hypothetical protein
MLRAKGSISDEVFRKASKWLTMMDAIEAGQVEMEKKTPAKPAGKASTR